MSRLIDADGLFNWGNKKLKDAAKYGNKNGEQHDWSYSTLMMYEIADEIYNAPTIDAVPVVRCKDCKYRTWFAPYYGCGNFESPFYSAVDGDVAIMTKPDDYCSYGERREEA